MDHISAHPLVGEEDLQAYVDGQLDGCRREIVEGYLSRHPEEARRIAAYGSQNLALHAAFDAVAEQPLPPRIAALVAKLVAALETPDSDQDSPDEPENREARP